LDAVRDTGGGAVAVTDEEILTAARLLMRAGLFVEPSSAAPLAGLRKLIAARPEIGQETIVCIVTSSGLKWLDSYGAEAEAGGDRISTAADGLAAVATHATQLRHQQPGAA